MRSPLVIRAAAFAGALLVGTPSTRADEREDRDRAARAALALTAPAKKLAAAAPKPREVGAEYATAYARAVEQAKPLVVYVGCKADHKAPGAVPAKADALPGVKGPAAVVMYPRGDGMLVHRVMECPVDDAELQNAIKDAVKKSNTGVTGKNADKPAPKPLDWQIRADFERDARTELDYLRDSFVRVRTDRFGGSGVVAWSEPGRSLVFTCWHVIADGSPVVVRTGGRTLPAKVVEVDRAADVALLEVSRELPAVVAVEADAPAVGDEVLMLGASSIWSRGKVLDTEDANGRASASGDFEGYSGDSGGPVFCRGALVGIVRGVGIDDGRAKFSTRVGPMLVRGIKREPVAAKGAPPAVLPPAVVPAPAKPLPAAAPVTLPASGCAGGNCPAPSYAPVRGGLFRRW